MTKMNIHFQKQEVMIKSKSQHFQVSSFNMDNSMTIKQGFMIINLIKRKQLENELNSIHFSVDYFSEAIIFQFPTCFLLKAEVWISQDILVISSRTQKTRPIA